jgi:flagellar biogenesis protein FliO
VSSLTRQITRFGAQLWNRLRPLPRTDHSLQVVERITIAPKQSLALITVDGERLLVAFAADGAPAFLALQKQFSGPQDSAPVQPSLSIPLLGRVS